MQAPNQIVLLAREQTRQRVSEVLKGNFGPQYSVECFGSTVYRADSASSDLDMVILVSRPASLATVCAYHSIAIGWGQTSRLFSFRPRRCSFP